MTFVYAVYVPSMTSQVDRLVRGCLKAIRATFVYFQRISHESFDTYFHAVRSAESGRL